MDQARKVCIVLDTNVWRESNCLRAPSAISLVDTGILLGAMIGLPEVVERELKILWRDDAEDSLEVAQRFERTIGRALSLPTIEQIEHVLAGRLEELASLIVRVPLTIEHARGALDRIDQHLPPCGQNNEQFRDCAIWEAALELAQKFDVHFITLDGKFFVKGSDDLAPNLVEDIQRVGGGIRYYRTIDACLEVLRPDVKPIKDEELATAVAKAIREILDKKLARTTFAISELRGHSVKVYGNGKPIVTLRYSLTFSLTSERDDRRDGKLLVSGDCRFDQTSKVASEAELSSGEITWIDPDGKKHLARTRRRLPVFAIDSGLHGTSLTYSSAQERPAGLFGSTLFNVYGNTVNLDPPNLNLATVDPMYASLLGTEWEEIPPSDRE